VPGGRIRKEERISAALRRLMREELGLEPGQEAALAEREVEGGVQGGSKGPGGPVFRAVHEHFYDTNFANEAGSSTHYVVLAYALRWPGGGAELPLLQHAAYRWLAPEEVLADAGVHAYTKAYFA